MIALVAGYGVVVGVRSGAPRPAFRAREADESHRARLRVEIGRLRAQIAPLATITSS